ncbi:MAG: hypothetical protein QGH47_04545, partial [Candidatus Woesearchaeota archaeon]|nr:hypothetical protein [Candidatus Woesearchaeota archaeon]
TNMSAFTTQNISTCIRSGNKTMFCTFIFSMLSNNSIGELTISLQIQNTSDIANALIVQSGSAAVGQIFVDFSDVVIQGYKKSITKTYFGEVKFADQKILSSGELRIESDKETRHYSIRNNQFSNVRIEGKKESIVSFYINDLLVGKDRLNSPEPKQITLILSVPSYRGGFTDSDRDGIPDNRDSCPTSQSRIVDVRGCEASCDDEIQNQNEEAIDCGGVCKRCKSKSSITGAAVADTTNCKEDGCPAKFTCAEDGLCKMTIQRQGKVCKTSETKFDKNLKCSEFGEEWILEEKAKYVSVKVDGFPLIEDIGQDIAEDMFNEYNICVRTDNIGCNVEQAKCPHENYLTEENKKKASKIIKEEIEKRLDLPSIIDFFIDVEVDVNLDSFRFDRPYNCSDSEIFAKDSCKAAIKNGPPEEKIDLLFIGDGYDGDADLKEHVLELISYTEPETNSTERTPDLGFGLFSEEPFKSNKEKFNVWYLDVTGQLNYFQDEDSFEGLKPGDRDAFLASNNCPWYDYISVLSRKIQFRSSCVLGAPGPCKNSIVEIEQHPSRLILHELGHGIGKLEDEYYSFIEQKEGEINLVKYFSEFQIGINCQNTEQKARQAWQGLDVGYFKGCGGDCGEECGEYIRPSFNSIMRHQDEKCAKDKEEQFCEEEECHIEGDHEACSSFCTIGCPIGPPFDHYNSVSKRQIQEIINEFA